MAGQTSLPWLLTAEDSSMVSIVLGGLVSIMTCDVLLSSERQVFLDNVILGLELPWRAGQG